MFLQTGHFHGPARTLYLACRNTRYGSLALTDILAASLAVLGIAVALAFLFTGLVIGSALPEGSPVSAGEYAPPADNYANGYSSGYRAGRQLAVGQKRRLTRSQADLAVRRHLERSAARLEALSQIWKEGYGQGLRFGLRQGLIDRFPSPARVRRGEYAAHPYRVVKGEIGPIDPSRAKEARTSRADLARAHELGNQTRSERQPVPTAAVGDERAADTGSIRRLVQPDGTVVYTNL